MVTTTWFEIIFFARVCCHGTTSDNVVFIDTIESNLTNKKSEDFSSEGLLCWNVSCETEEGNVF